MAGRDDKLRDDPQSEDTYTIKRGGYGYPVSLEKLSDPPDNLYIRGEIPSGPMVAIVGSRKSDPTTTRFVFQLAGELTAHGIVVLSGGADGVDTAAHEGALDADGLTVAVIGSGFNFMYPKSNEALFHKVSKRGAVLSEFAPEQPPAKWTFPKRNRLVAAMAGAVVVAQAGQRSGALITARIARELGVGLGAVPGRAGDPRNAGGHQLLRAGAALVENGRDVLSLLESKSSPDQLGLPGIMPTKNRRIDHKEVSPRMRKILDIVDPGPVHIDKIISGSGLSSGEATAILMTLEINGFVEDMGGRNYSLIVS